MKICIDGLSFSYGKKQILRGVSMEIPSGNLCFFLGENGAGKSTLLKCINHILRPNAGTVTIDGINVADLSIRQRAKYFGYVPQATVYGSSLHVFDTVASGLQLSDRQRQTGGSRFEEIRRLLQVMGLEPLAFRPMGSLSGGERQRVLITRALALRPRIMLLDEPTNNLDLRYQLETMELLSQISHELHITTAAVVHDLNLALQYANQAVLLRNGGIYKMGRPAEILTKDSIREVFGVDTELARFQDRGVVLPQRKAILSGRGYREVFGEYAGNHQ